MRKAYIIRENRDFKRLYARGRFMAQPLLVTYAMRNSKGISRYGITASKKIGNAVKRNRAKRLIRAAWQELEGGLPAGWDFIFVARTRTTYARMQEVKAAMGRQIDDIIVKGKSGTREKGRK